MALFEQLSKVNLLRLLSKDELSLFAAACEKGGASPQQVIFNEDDPGDTLYLLTQGSVQIIKHLMEGQEEMMPVIYEGDVFGEMAFIDETLRSSTAMALEPCEMFTITRERYDRLLRDKPEMSLKINQEMNRILTRRLRATSDRVKECIQWNLEISGAATLGIQHLISAKVQIEIELVNGRRISGNILLVVHTQLGYQITVKDNKGRLYIIPYSAINYISVLEDDFKKSTRE